MSGRGKWVEAERVLREVFPGWRVTAAGYSARATWDIEDDGAPPAWTFDDLAKVSEALGTRLIDVVADDSRAMGSEWTGPYGTVSLTVKVRREAG